tara:strand:+ start:276 stop:851 length:576 start_codon:yes stop_codon:yes gene_type:complete
MMVFKGRISSSGFESGDCLVIGDWLESPLGSFTNIMWARSDGTRVLLSPSQEHAKFVSSLYSFDEIKITDIYVERMKRRIKVVTDHLEVSISWGRSLLLPLPRPLWFIASIENIFGKIFFGSKTFGLARDGSKEWYSIRGISKVVSAEAKSQELDFGKMAPNSFSKPFGFSSPPKIPTSIIVNSHIDREKP